VDDNALVSFSIQNSTHPILRHMQLDVELTGKEPDPTGSCIGLWVSDFGANAASQACSLSGAAPMHFQLQAGGKACCP
jgi:hypothetical protein